MQQISLEICSTLKSLIKKIAEGIARSWTTYRCTGKENGYVYIVVPAVATFTNDAY